MKLRPLAWGARVTPEFRGKARSVAVEIGAEPSDFMAAMAFETGGTFNPAVRNKQSGATGLIQFMPKTALALGTTVDELARMTAVEQLEWVKKYFVQNGYAGRIGTLPDLYMAILWPAAIGKPADYVLIQDDDGKAYIQNKGLDLNQDGNITKAEAADLVRKSLQNGLLEANATNYETEESMDASAAVSGIGGLVSMLNPAAAILFSAFSPLIKQQIAAGIDKHSGTPGVGQAVADSLSDAILGTAKAQTGKTDDLEAVAVARQNVAMVEAAQTAAVDAMAERLKQLGPLLDKSIEYDKAKWAAEAESKKLTSAIAIEEHRSGLWDMTATLVSNTEGQVWFILVALATGVGAGFWYNKDAIAYAILTLAGPILGQIMKNKAQPNDYRFDGTKASSDQSKAVMEVMKQDSAQRGA